MRGGAGRGSYAAGSGQPPGGKGVVSDDVKLMGHIPWAS
jgi:hypothetical protein